MTSIQLPKTIGRYKLTRFLNRGGMGEVFLATDESLQRNVAVKVLRLAKDEPEKRARFMREARAVAALNHPNVVVIHEIGSAENFVEDNSVALPFLVMEFVDGQPLEHMMRSRRLSPYEAVTFACQIAEGLKAAHDRRILHRDIKPSNMMVTPDGRIKILDFGISKILQPEETETAEGITQMNDTGEGVILGTIRYLSPEQARGGQLDKRSDIFAFGIVLYEMLTGRHPFLGGSTLETVTKIVIEEPYPFPEPNSIPESLKKIIALCLKKQPDERYSGFSTVLTDLEAVKHDLYQTGDTRIRSTMPLESVQGPTPNTEPTESLDQQSADLTETKTLVPSNNPAMFSNVTEEAPPVEPTDETKTAKTTRPLTLDLDEPPKKRFSPRLAASVTAGVVVLALAVFSATQYLRSTRKPVPPNFKATQLTISAGLDVYPTFSPDGNSIAYCSDKSGHFEIFVKPLTPGSRETQVTTDGGHNFQPAWSPDGQWIAYHSKSKGGIWIVPAAGGTPKQLTDFGSRPMWSPDGSFLAFQSDGLTDLSANAAPAQPPSTIWTVSLQGLPPRQVTQIGTPSGGHGTPSFSPDGKRITFASYDRRTSAIWSISADGKDLKQIVSTQRYIYDPVHAPDGTGIYYSAVLEDGNFGLWEIMLDPATGNPEGEPVQLANLGLGTIRHLFVSRDGTKIAYGNLTMNSNLRSQSISPTTLQPEGNPRPLTAETARNSRPTFSPDGSRIAFEKWRPGTNPDIWVADADGKNPIQLTIDPAVETVPSWMPGGNEVLFRSNRGDKPALWSVRLDSRKETRLAELQPDFDFPRLSPDGKRFAFNSKRGNNTTNVWTGTLGGGTPKQITFDSESLGFPCWSPDGSWLALQLKRGENTHLVVVSSEGGQVTELVAEPGQSWPYSWSPDGDKIAFAALRDGHWNVRTVSRTTRRQTSVTNFDTLNAYVRYPAWSPKGDRIVFEYAETVGNIWILQAQPEPKK